MKNQKMKNQKVVLEAQKVVLEIQSKIDRLLFLAQKRLNAMSPRELMADVTFMEFCASYGLVREVA